MRFPARSLLLLLPIAAPALAQLPFYTDDPAVTDKGKWHFEFFNEYDGLQLQLPNLRQNTANYKLNYGLPHNLGVGCGRALSRYLPRRGAAPNAVGGGDTNAGIKWEFHKESKRVPAFGASFLCRELPTGRCQPAWESGTDRLLAEPDYSEIAFR